MPEIAQEYRRKAEACRRPADPTPEPDRQMHWLDQADEWEKQAANESKVALRRTQLEAGER